MALFADLFQSKDVPKATRVPKLSDPQVQGEAQKERRRVAGLVNRQDTILGGGNIQRKTLLGQ